MFDLLRMTLFQYNIINSDFLLSEKLRYMKGPRCNKIMKPFHCSNINPKIIKFLHYFDIKERRLAIPQQSESIIKIISKYTKLRACDINDFEDTRVFDKYSKWTKFPDGLFPPFLLFALLNLFIATLSQQKLFMACLLCVHYTQITSFPYQHIMWILNQIYECIGIFS